MCICMYVHTYIHTTYMCICLCRCSLVPLLLLLLSFCWIGLFFQGHHSGSLCVKSGLPEASLWNSCSSCLTRRVCVVFAVCSSSQSTVDASKEDIASSSKESVVCRLLTHCDNGRVCCRFITSAVSICRVWLSYQCSVMVGNETGRLSDEIVEARTSQLTYLQPTCSQVYVEQVTLVNELIFVVLVDTAIGKLL